MQITSSAIELGTIMKKMSMYDLPLYDFSMKDFVGRLKVQKIVYIIQTFGVYLGYDFSYYLHGPYCSKLAQTGSEVSQIYDEVQVSDGILFQDEDMEEKYAQSIKLLKKLDSTNKLEIATSLHLLNHCQKMEKNKAIDTVVHKVGKNFTQKQCENMWELLESFGLVDNK